MVTEKDINDMYIHLRKTNCSIPDEALDFMRTVCMDKLKLYKSQNHTTLNINSSEFGLKLEVRENFKNKDNRGAVLLLTPHDLSSYQMVGNKLRSFGLMITKQNSIV